MWERECARDSQHVTHPHLASALLVSNIVTTKQSCHRYQFYAALVIRRLQGYISGCLEGVWRESGGSLERVSGGWLEESSHPIKSSRKLVQISFVSVQICTLQVSQSRIPDQIYRFLSKFENKD